MASVTEDSEIERDCAAPEIEPSSAAATKYCICLIVKAKALSELVCTKPEFLGMLMRDARALVRQQATTNSICPASRPTRHSLADSCKQSNEMLAALTKRERSSLENCGASQQPAAREPTSIAEDAINCAHVGLCEGLSSCGGQVL